MSFLKNFRNQRTVSILMAVVLLFTTFMQPLVVLGDNSTVSLDDEIVEEILLDGDEAIIESNEIDDEVEKEEVEVEESETQDQGNDEPVKNKGDPVIKFEQLVEGQDKIKVKAGEKVEFENKLSISNVESDLVSLTDELDDRLNVLGATVLVDGEESDFEATIKGQTVKLTLDREALEVVKGKEITLNTSALVNENAESGEISSFATLEFDDHDQVMKTNKTKIEIVTVESEEKQEKESNTEEVKESNSNEKDESKEYKAESNEFVEKDEKESSASSESSSVEATKEIKEIEVVSGDSEEQVEEEEIERELESSIVAEYDEKEENLLQRSLSFFSLTKSNGGKDISKDVKVSNLKATPNSGSKQVWETQFGRLSFDLSIPDSAQGGDKFVVKIKGINSLQDFENVEKIVTTDGRTIGEFSYKRRSGESILTGTLYEEIDNKINVSVKMNLGFKIDESYRGKDTPSSVTSVTNDVIVYTEGSSRTIQITSKLFNILTKFTVHNNIFGNEKAAELEIVARISSNERSVNGGTLTLTPVKGFTIPKNPEIGLQGWVYTKQADGTYKVGSKRFEVEVIESKKDKLVIKTPKLVNSGDKIELLRIAVEGNVNNPSKINYKSTSTDEIQVKGEFNSSTSGYKDLTHIGNSNLYYSKSIGADAEEFEASIRVIKQDKETKDRLEGAVFEVRDEKGKLIKKLTTNKKGEASVKNLSKGKYTIVEVEAPKGYKLNDREEVINVKDPKEYVYKMDNEYQPKTPDIAKDVEGTDHLEVAHEEAYNYNVKVDIPKSINGYKDLAITDVLDNRLNVLGATVLVDGEESDFEATIKGQTVKLTLDREALEVVKGKEINLQITASIKTGTDIELIDNKATIQLNDNPEVESNVVTVIPPKPTTPDIAKDVEGEDHLEVAHEEAYNYNVKTDVPTELGGYKDLAITDVLDNRLNVLGATVLVDGEESDFEATIKGQTVKLTLDREALEVVKGKEVNLQITASIKTGTDIELIDNKATIQLNDNPEVESNVVTVIPTKPIIPEPEEPEQPKLKKFIPVEPEQPVKPEDKPEESTETEDPVEGLKLPKTATTFFTLMLIGLGLLTLGSVFYLFKRKLIKEE